MRWIKIVGLLSVIVLAYGACMTMGAPIRASSPYGYVGSLLAIGFLGLLAEGAAGHVLGKDRTTDPLARRVGRLLLALGISAVILALIGWLFGTR